MEFDLFMKSVINSITIINNDIEKLHSHKMNNNCQVLNHLRREVKILENKIDLFRQCDDLNNTNSQPKIYANQMQPPQERIFTLEELSQYNGRNGNPAYVAVNGVVYDVSNVPAWAFPTHFGLSAGNDLTTEFELCHGSAIVLERLPVVGILLQ